MSYAIDLEAATPEMLGMFSRRAARLAFIGSARMHVDLQVPRLVTHAIERGEGALASNGALTVSTGKRTGRSPKDRFIVYEEDSADHIDWGVVNQPFEAASFDDLWQRAMSYLRGRELFIVHARVGADPAHRLSLRIVSETAWQALFARQLFIRPPRSQDAGPVDWTIVTAPSLVTDPKRDGTASDGVVIIHPGKRRVLLCGMQYAGEMKKAMFTVMNYLMPSDGVLPMHCAANVGEDGDVALFFGLSGTGKTTLSADSDRFLIGDDEHGWSDNGIFNFEGGCYAKCINLSPVSEPVIWRAIRFGAIMENVPLDPVTHQPLYDDESITQNTRAAYPREHVAKRMPGNRAHHPDAIIFLTCDLHGVLPPVALLSKEQAAYHYLSGYTALVGGTEVGQFEAVKSTFSACFGAPFFPRPAQEYAHLLMERIARHAAPVYLVNTGWTGGAYGHGGRRFEIATTRNVIHAILRGEIERGELDYLPGLNLQIPRHVRGLDSTLLNPRNTWQDQRNYDHHARELVVKFTENFKRFPAVARQIRDAGPHL